jgi:hypothetical protein
VLQILPQVNEGDAETGSALVTRQGNLVEVEGLQCRAGDIDMVLNLIVSAYLLFDPHGLGHIDKKSVTNMISEAKGTEQKNAMLSQQRWDEMVSISLPCSSLPPPPFPHLFALSGLGC